MIDHYTNWLITLLLSICVSGGPLVFCKMRYTKKRKEELSKDYKNPKLQLEVAHFLKIKLRKSYRVHSRIDHPEFYTPKSF